MASTTLSFGAARQRENSVDRAVRLAAYGFVWLYAAYVVLCSFAGPASKFDDFIPLIGGILIGQGQTPNLDFSSFYPPLNLYLSAAALSAFGKTVLAVRVLGGFLYLMVLVLAARFFRVHFGPSGLLAPLATLLLAAAIGSAIRMPSWPGVALCLIALLTYLWSHSLFRARLWVIGCAGVLTGLALLCRVNFGAYVVLAIFLDLALPPFDSRWRWKGVDLRAALRESATFVVSLGTTCLAIGLLIYGSQIGAAASEPILTLSRVMAARFHPLQVYGEMSSAIALPSAWFLFRILQDSDRFGGRAFLAAMFIPVTLGVAFAGRGHHSTASLLTVLEIAIVLFLHMFVRRLKPSEFTALIFYCGLLHYFLSRSDFAHWRVIPIGYAVLLPLLLYPGRRSGEAQFQPGLANGTALAVLIIAFIPMVTFGDRPSHNELWPGLSLLTGLVRNPYRSDSDRVRTSDAAPYGWASVYPDRDEWRAVRYLQAHTSDTEPVFVGVREHARVFWADLRFYWLADRPIGARTFQLEIMNATEEPVQRGIIEDLRRNQVRWIILDHADDGDSPFRRAGYRGSAVLDEYIRVHFKEEARFGNYAVLSRVVD